MGLAVLFFMLNLIVIAASTLGTAAPCSGMAMVYYGGSSADYATIEQYPPEIIVPADIPTLAANAAALHAAGVGKVLAYIPTACANTGCFGDSAPLSQVESEVDQAMGDGADGLFFDEATPGPEPYYASLYGYVKSTYGQQTLVVVNPGIQNPDPGWFSAPETDVVCLECQWQGFIAADYPGIPANHFWGLASGSGDCGNLFSPSAADAIANAQSAEGLGVGYFYETSAYVNLPSWYPTYYQGLVNAGLCQGGGSDGGSTAGGPLVTELFLAQPGTSAPLSTVEAGGSYDLVLGVSDPKGFSALGFADLWWSASGVSVGTIANRGGPYEPGENYILSYSLAAPSGLWAQQTAESSGGWVNITGAAGLYADGTSYVVDAQSGLARATITLPNGPEGTWTLSSYVQELPFGGTDSPLVAESFVVVAADAGPAGSSSGQASAGTSSQGQSSTGGSSGGVVSAGSSSGGSPSAGSSSGGSASAGSSSTGQMNLDPGKGGGAAGASSGAAAGNEAAPPAAGCGCSGGAEQEALSWLGLVAAVGLRRRRRS